MKQNRFAVVLLMIVVCFLLTSCSDIGADVDNILEAPKLTGDLFSIQQAVENYSQGDISLKYPKKGDYRSAFVLYDVDHDEKDEAIAFYSLANDTKGDIYIAFVDQQEDHWKVLGSIPISATDVEQVNFADIDGDGKSEIVVGWNIFSKVEKQVAIYASQDGKFTQRFLENYTEYALCDLMETGYSQLLTVNLNTNDKTSVAKLYHLDNDGVVEDGTVSLDGGVTAYLTPVVNELASGRPAVYLDANKGASAMITEIIYYTTVKDTPELDKKDTQNNYALVRTSSLVSPFHDSTTFENGITSRPVSAQIQDINGDGIMDIPLMTELPGFSSRSDDEKIYYTVWRNYDEKKFSNVLTAVMNYVEGYYLVYPDKWLDYFNDPDQWKKTGISAITVSKNPDYSEFVFSEWNSTTQSRGDDLFKIQVFTRDGWENRDLSIYGDSFPIRYGKDLVYCASIVNEDKTLSLTENEIKQVFRLINE